MHVGPTAYHDSYQKPQQGGNKGQGSEVMPLQTPQWEAQEMSERKREVVGYSPWKGRMAFFLTGAITGVCLGIFGFYFIQQQLGLLPNCAGLEGNETIRGGNVTMTTNRWENAGTTLSPFSNNTDGPLGSFDGSDAGSEWLSNSSPTGGGSTTPTSREEFIKALQQWMLNSLKSCLEKNGPLVREMRRCVENHACRWVTTLHRGMGKIPSSCGVQGPSLNQSQKECVLQRTEQLLEEVAMKMVEQCN